MKLKYDFKHYRFIIKLFDKVLGQNHGCWWFILVDKNIVFISINNVINVSNLSLKMSHKHISLVCRRHHQIFLCLSHLLVYKNNIVLQKIIIHNLLSIGIL